MAAGPPVTGPGGHCHFLGGVAAPTGSGVRRMVREHVERSVDVLKIMASGDMLTPGTCEHLAQFDAVVLRAAVDEAHRHGLPVTVHAHGTQAIADAISAGVDGLEHASFWSAQGVNVRDDLMSLIAERRIVVGATAGIARVPGAELPPDIARRIPMLTANHRRLHELGAPVVAGTDAGVSPLKPHGVLATAPAMLQLAGLTPAEALRAVTSVSAAVCRLGHRKGRIAPGFDADLLAVAGDPLADPTALQRVVAVYLRGTRIAA